MLPTISSYPSKVTGRRPPRRPVTLLLAPILGAMLTITSLYSFQAYSATLSIRSDVDLSITRRNITGVSGAGSQRTDNIGRVTSTLAPVINTALDPLEGINPSLVKNSSNTWEMKFDSGEWFGGVNVSYQLVDAYGNSNRISSVSTPNSSVPVTVATGGIRQRRYRDNSVRWYRGDTRYSMNILSARAAGAYTGVLTIQVTFN